MPAEITVDPELSKLYPKGSVLEYEGTVVLTTVFIHAR